MFLLKGDEKKLLDTAKRLEVLLEAVEGNSEIPKRLQNHLKACIKNIESIVKRLESGN